MAAGLGLDATGAGLAPSAVDTARLKARQRHRTTRFLRHDAQNPADPGESFGAVLDCGLFNVFGDGDRPPTPATCGPRWRPLRPVLSAVQQRHPAPGGPARVHRVSQDKPCASFADGWHIGAIEPATIAITTDPDGIRAWLAALTRT